MTEPSRSRSLEKRLSKSPEEYGEEDTFRQDTRGHYFRHTSDPFLKV